jgi:hypothetical protein
MFKFEPFFGKFNPKKKKKIKICYPELLFSVIQANSDTMLIQLSMILLKDYIYGKVNALNEFTSPNNKKPSRWLMIDPILREKIKLNLLSNSGFIFSSNFCFLFSVSYVKKVIPMGFKELLT